MAIFFAIPVKVIRVYPLKNEEIVSESVAIQSGSQHFFPDTLQFPSSAVTFSGPLLSRPKIDSEDDFAKALKTMFLIGTSTFLSNYTHQMFHQKFWVWFNDNFNTKCNPQVNSTAEINGITDT